MTSPARAVSPSVVPVVLSGFCAFLTLFAPQPILPLLADLFHAGKVTISLMITASTLGVALAAPMIGQIADRVGRKRIIVLSASTLGVATPGVFSVTTAYVHDEWPAGHVASAISAYVSGTIVGGFSGRVVIGFMAEHLGWRWAFVALGCVSLAIAAYLWARLPGERRFALPPAPTRLVDGMLDHLRNKELVAAYCVGSCVLFSLTALFTYVTFRLAAPPFSLSPGLIGSIYVVYLVGAVVTPLAGRRIDRDGHGKMMIRAASLGVTGALLSLFPNVWMVIAGLAVCCSGTFIAQASATSFVGTAAKHNRGLALGLYVSFYYAGGSLGGTAPGWLWQNFGWPGCVALVVVVQLVIAVIARTCWYAITPAGVPANGPDSK